MSVTRPKVSTISIGAYPENSSQVIRTSGTSILNLNDILTESQNDLNSGGKTAIGIFRRQIRDRLKSIDDVNEIEFHSDKEDQRALRQDLERAWDANLLNETETLNTIRGLSTAWILEKRAVVREFGNSQTSRHVALDKSMQLAPPGTTVLITRAGIVEQRIINAFVSSEVNLRNAVQDVTSRRLTDEFMFSPSHATHLSAGDDLIWAFRLLMTNAGMYLPEQPGAAIEVVLDWAQRYLAAQQASDSYIDLGHFGHCPHAYFAAHVHRTNARVPVRFSGREFLNQLKGHRIVIASPFWQQLNSLYRGGRIPRLFENFELPEFELVAVPAQISTWPNRPGESWAATFEALVDKSLQALQDANGSLFLASCGSYGLPLAHQVHIQTGVSAVYVGHVVNTLLGVWTRRAANGLGGLRPQRSQWLQSHLGTYENMTRIDGGGYL